jgi:hypothetical protein
MLPADPYDSTLAGAIAAAIVGSRPFHPDDCEAEQPNRIVGGLLVSAIRLFPEYFPSIKRGKRAVSLGFLARAAGSIQGFRVAPVPRYCCCW